MANRLTEIPEHTEVHEWRHVASQDNVADLALRGIKATEKEKINLWLYGPAFLRQDEETWQQEKQSEAPLNSADVYTLQASHDVTSLIIRHYHVTNGHMGVAKVLASLQENISLFAVVKPYEAFF